MSPVYRSANAWKARLPFWQRLFTGMHPVTSWLLLANVAVFVVFGLGELFRIRGIAALEILLALSREGMRDHCYWQPVTYLFLHADFWHILLNMLTLFFLGPQTERSMGSLHFGIMYFLSGIVGGLGWLALSDGNALCVGASGAIFGVMGAFATLYPRQRLTFFLYFVPISTEAWKLVLGLTVVQFLFLLGGATGGIAYAAHVAGAFAGFLYIDQLYESAHFRRLVRKIAGFFGSGTSSWKPRMPKMPERRPDDRPSEDEVNRILDKISREGIQSLTRAERDTLHRASARF